MICLNQNENVSLLEIFTSAAHEISTEIKRLLNWPDTGRGPRGLSFPVGAAVFVLAICAFATTGFAQINVETTQDRILVDGNCALREAVINANDPGGVDQSGNDCEAGTGGGADVINLPAGTYRLTITGAGEEAALTGDLDVTEDLTINGANPRPTIVGFQDRVFDVMSSASLTIDNVSITNGSARAGAPDDNGGGIQAGGGTTVMLQNNANIENNSADNNGGGIYCTGCTLDITESTIVKNTANNNRNGAGDGGGIYIDGLGFAALNLTNSIIGGDTTRNINKNSAVNGGGLAIGDDVAVTIVASTISGNEATNNGGGIHDARTSLGSVEIVNSTISGNEAINNGGGLFINDTSVQTPSTTIKNVTISANTADSDNRNGGSGGGIFHNAGFVQIFNTIIAQNIDESSEPDCNSQAAGINSGGNNLVGDNTGCETEFPEGNPNANDDLVGTAASPIDARLEPLANNLPGDTLTHMLLSDSPAIDMGENTVCNDGDVDGVDQRAIDRPQQFNSLNSCDIGAIELQRFEQFASTQQVTVTREFQVPFNCGIDQETITNMGNEFISKEKHETYIKIINPEVRRLIIFRASSQAQIAESLTLNNPANFQVPGVMSPFALLKLNPGKSIQITCEELLKFPIELNMDGSIATTLLDELGDPDTFFQGTLFLQTNSRNVEVHVTNVTQTWTATPPLGGGSPAEFTGGERLSESQQIDPVTISGRQLIDFRVVPQGDPTTVAAASAAAASATRPAAAVDKPGFVTLSSRSGDSVEFRAQGIHSHGLSVEIYSLTGQKIFSESSRSNSLRWNMQNSNGQRVANGVYLYILRSIGPDGKTIQSQVKKLVVLR